MATDLVVHGPFAIPFRTVKGTEKFIGKEHYEAFQQDLEQRGIAAKHGCYVFAMKAGRGYSPWYVGKSTSGLGRECLGDHKIKLFNRHLMKGYKGLPVMFFIAPAGTVNKVPRDVCDEVETFLIQAAHARNPNLLNSRKKSVLYWSIQGITGDSRRTVPAEAMVFKTMIGL